MLNPPRLHAVPTASPSPVQRAAAREAEARKEADEALEEASTILAEARDLARAVSELRSIPVGVKRELSMLWPTIDAALARCAAVMERVG